MSEASSEISDIQGLCENLKHLVNEAFAAKGVAESSPSDIGSGPVDTWFYATVEVLDRESDIIRVAGCDVSDFARTGPIKVLSSHTRTPNASSRLPLCGKVVRWRRTTHPALGVPALLAGVVWAPTELGREMKALADGEFLTDVSIGARYIEAVPRNPRDPSAGLDVRKCSIAELSVCCAGMNQYAGLAKALGMTGGPSPDDVQKMVREQVAAIRTQLTDRLDDIECLVAVMLDESKKQFANDDDSDEGAAGDDGADGRDKAAAIGWTGDDWAKVRKSIDGVFAKLGGK